MWKPVDEALGAAEIALLEYEKRRIETPAIQLAVLLALAAVRVLRAVVEAANQQARLRALRGAKDRLDGPFDRDKTRGMK